MEAAEMAAGQAAIELAHLKSGLNLLDLNDSVVMFCDFYRAQAWYRWMRSNGSAKSSLKFLLQQVPRNAAGLDALFLANPPFVELRRCMSSRQSSCFNAARMEIQRRQSVKNPAGYLVACRDGILLRDVELATVLKTDEWLSDAHCKRRYSK
ncbi:hypothetical protein CAPTEDRAFT_207620 [Capitella teleta]|uniref:Uncharacterized protein n=1 Tax=Capitella teleta TaxID=283909 RepID=R7USJ8_CAPTE|nr:hypothetical protein CAPTEDRAFT_207620 [Capitella teleta]|eukprot:ELU06386.1 hypothetical protein CAPTEDRAFT_207620 [Capitella teleta]